jgi:hypothetical protein
MRQHLAKLGLLSLVGACSLIYDPSGIKKAILDAPTSDIEIIADANPSGLEIDDVYPTTVLEGAGTGNSRPAVVMLKGHNFVKAASGALVVTVSPATDATIAADGFKVASDGNYIVVALDVPIDTACTTPTTKPLTVTVKQNDSMGGTISKSTDMLAVQCLPEWSGVSQLAPLYSQITITTPLTFAPTSAATAPVSLRAVSSISIPQTIIASAAAAMPGPGGGIGGPPSTAGGGPQPGQHGTNNTGLNVVGGNGGGGGFATAGGYGGGDGMGGNANADLWLSNLTKSASSGGGGGGSSLAGPGGAGGAGGGTIEVSAGGDLTVGAITTNGGDAAAGTGATKGGNGGAGTGGAVLLRAGGTLSAGTLTMRPGNVAASGDGGTGSVGLARVDAAMGSVPGNATLGPIVFSAPSLTTSYPVIMFHGSPNDGTATLKVFDSGGQPVPDKNGDKMFSLSFGNTTPVGTAMFMTTLEIGYNNVCAIVAGGDPQRPESLNCVEVGYAP